MWSTRIKISASVAAAALAAFGAYNFRASTLASAWLALLGACFLVIAWRLATGRRRHEGLHDPALSTLVFPPESKFAQSVFTRD